MQAAAGYLPLKPTHFSLLFPLMQPLAPNAIVQALSQVPLWRPTGDPATAITRTFEFPDFPDALLFVNDVGQAAEEAGHHPDIDIRWNKVILSLTTHDAGGLTSLDFDLAARCDQLAV
jgi:4a-hydroxytetrahydrobiopterin dehydratase